LANDFLATDFHGDIFNLQHQPAGVVEVVEVVMVELEDVEVGVEVVEVSGLSPRVVVVAGDGITSGNTAESSA
jgi:hypothetical protein